MPVMQAAIIACLVTWSFLGVLRYAVYGKQYFEVKMWLTDLPPCAIGGIIGAMI